jgi:hypothetical protein
MMADYPESLAHVLARLEPDSGYEGCAHARTFTPELRAAISTAISLRRIADALEGGPSGYGLNGIGEALVGIEQKR